MNVLITGAWRTTEEDRQMIEAMGHSVLFMKEESSVLPCPPEWVEALICNGFFLHHPAEELTGLRLVQLTSAGTDRVPVAELERRGVRVRNAAGVYSIPMAECVLGGVLALYKNTFSCYEDQKQHFWGRDRYTLELSGKTVLIIGCGHVGQECAKRFSAFGCRVLGVDRSRREAPFFDELCPLEKMNELLPDADIVVLALALTEGTRGIFGADAFHRLRSGAVFVNVSRGALADENAMKEALPRLTGAVLDVFSTEPLPAEDPLWDMKNVILTPHISFRGDGNRERLRAVILHNLEECNENSDHFTEKQNSL